MSITKTQFLDISIMLKVITDEDNNMLIRIFTTEEVEQVVRALPRDKVPFLDRFSAMFYKSYWHVIKKELCLEVNHFP